MSDLLIGYCTECGTKVFKSNKIPDTDTVYECSYCGYPNADYELWDKLPDYLIEYRKENGLE